MCGDRGPLPVIWFRAAVNQCGNHSRSDVGLRGNAGRVNLTLSLRDKVEQADPDCAAVPRRMIERVWMNGRLETIDNSFDRDQLAAHVAELESQVTNFSRGVQRQSCGLLD